MNTLAEEFIVSGQFGVGSEAGTDALAGALNHEAELLRNLLGVLRQQREGVAADDLEVVDETIYTAQRIFRTLGEARRRRKGLLQVVVGAEDVPLKDLPTSLGPRMTPALREAREVLQRTAKELSLELEVNRRVLSGAIRSGEELIMALCGKKPAGSGYGPNQEREGPVTESGIIINRQI